MSAPALAIATLPGCWRERAAELRAYGAEPQALALERAAAELEDAIRAERDELLSLDTAARASGFNADHLRRLVRSGKLPAQRRGRRLLFRAGDLPRRVSRRVDGPRLAAYDPDADARRVIEERAHGG